MSYRPPILLIGMHRSGTSMLTRMLEALGLFLGADKDPNHEARFFLHLNTWMLRQAGGSWDHPQPFLALLEDQAARRIVLEYVRQLSGSARIHSYLGVGSFLRCRSLHHLGRPWGWKDPRNTFTLPIWLDLFPGAKIIHIHRHPVDVAVSLKERHERALEASSTALGRKRAQRWHNPFRSRMEDLISSVRCGTLPGGFSLAQEYVGQARRHVEALGERACEVAFESFLAEPGKHLIEIARFCGLDPDDAQVRALTQKVDPSRAYAYRNDPVLRAFWQSAGGRPHACTAEPAASI